MTTRARPPREQHRRDRRAVTWFRAVYLVLVLNFWIPVISYIAAPHLAAETMDRVNRLLGGGSWPVESGQLWHMLAVGNVATLGFVCLLLLVDLERFYAALPGLAFLKAFSALYSLGLFLVHDLPAFLGVFCFDGATTAAMLFFAVRARRALRRLPDELRPLPLWVHAILLRPGRIRERLGEARRAGLVDEEPTLEQLAQGVLRMVHRLSFRSETIGTSRDPVRPTLRARLLHYRPLRFPFLVKERAIAPFDLSGLLSSKERLIRHLIAAHHDDVQFIYDLELLRCHPGGLEELEERARAVVEGRDARAEWLRDLVVFEGYHERLAQAVDEERRGKLPSPDDPDLSLRAYLAWCASRPSVIEAGAFSPSSEPRCDLPSLPSASASSAA